MEQTLPLPEGYVSSICEVKTFSDNELVATGVIGSITPDFIEIEDKSSTMSVVRYNTMVKVNVFNSRLGFRVLVGKVYISNLKFLRIMEVSTLLEHERRQFFRVSTNMHAHITQLKRGEPEGEEYQVLVKDLSLGGALFESERAWERGDELQIVMRLGRQTCKLKCIVIRAYEEREDHYACEFKNVSDIQANSLCAYIFQRQREQINKRQPRN